MYSVDWWYRKRGKRYNNTLYGNSIRIRYPSSSTTPCTYWPTLEHFLSVYANFTFPLNIPLQKQPISIQTDLYARQMRYSTALDRSNNRKQQERLNSKWCFDGSRWNPSTLRISITRSLLLCKSHKRRKCSSKIATYSNWNDHYQYINIEVENNICRTKVKTYSAITYVHAY
jgi:hypothetical protein